MKRIQIPQPITVKLIDDTGAPELDDKGNPKEIVCDLLWFIRPVLETAPAFKDSGHAGFRAGSRIEDAIVAALDAKASHVDIHDIDHEPLREYVDGMKDHPAYKVFGRRALHWVDPILNATDVQQEQEKEAAE